MGLKGKSQDDNHTEWTEENRKAFRMEVDMVCNTPPDLRQQVPEIFRRMSVKEAVRRFKHLFGNHPFWKDYED